MENIFIDIFQMNQLKRTDDRQFYQKKKAVLLKAFNFVKTDLKI